MGLDTYKPGTDAQPDPVGNGASVTDSVIQDLKDRREGGKKKYGTELRTNNGRDPLVDAYQEFLDFLLYIRQALMEKEDTKKDPVMGSLLDKAQALQGKLMMLRVAVTPSYMWLWDDSMKVLNGIMEAIGRAISSGYLT